MPPPAERFWTKVDKAGPAPTFAPELGPCWLWTAALSHGYGMFGDGTKTDLGNWRAVKAHKWLWEQVNGPVPDGLELDHLCRVTRCVRPDHLEAVTHAVNMERAPWTAVQVNRAKTRCPAGHDYAEHGYFDPTVNGRRCRPCKRATAREATRRYREKARLAAAG